jgi:hypothetical protein
MGLLRECLFALRARQGDVETLDDKSPVEAEDAHLPHRAVQTTVPSTDRTRAHGAKRQAVRGKLNGTTLTARMSIE